MVECNGPKATKDVVYGNTIHEMVSK